MRRILESDRRGGWWLNGVFYATEAKYRERVAFDERCRARRARLLARIEEERDGHHVGGDTVVTGEDW
jgi:hypothetical protein